MVTVGFEPRAAGWKAQMNPLSHGGHQRQKISIEEGRNVDPQNIFPNEDKMQTEKNVPGVNRTKLPQNSNLDCTLARSNMVLLPSN